MQACSRCIYDETVPGISFDSNGVCNYCLLHEDLEKEYPSGEAGLNRLKEIAEEIKKTGDGKKYDCVVGVSGGCDSSYLLYLAKELGLRPLAVHYDNTWDSTIAVENIYNVIKKLGVDLYTYVVDNEEVNDIVKSFMKASVPEIEGPTDLALVTVLYMAAAEHGVKYIFDGHSFRTEGICPVGWFYFDGRYIKTVHKKFGDLAMKTFPNLTLLKWIKWITINNIKRIQPLWYVDLDKEQTKKFLTEKFGWKWYGGHHMENKLTLFSNKYYIPTKFGIDFRLLELCAFIRTGRITREKALIKLKEPLPDTRDLVEEFKKRLNLSDSEFEELMLLEKKKPTDYKTYRPIFRKMRFFFWLMHKMNKVPKGFYIKYTK